MLVHVWLGREEEQETRAIPYNLNIITGNDVTAPDKYNLTTGSDVTTPTHLTL